jgi:XkdW protein
MMTICDRIFAIYPTLTPQDFLTVIRLQNDSDGRGDYIAAWNHPTFAQPTQEQLDALEAK